MIKGKYFRLIESTNIDETPEYIKKILSSH